MTPSPSHKTTQHNLGNISKHEINDILISNGHSINLNSCPPSELASRDLTRPMTTSSGSPTWDLTAYQNRLRTFFVNNEWKLQFITPEAMAEAGLYYLGKQDRVRCMFCSKEFDYWQRGDDPLVEHKRKSPKCPFFSQSSGYDVCGPYGTPSIPSFQSINMQKIKAFLDAVGIVQQIKTPKHKEFASFETRLKTFDKCEKKMKQDTHSLCEAGFFYIGDGQNDQMLCFCCSQGLKDWEDNDEPWTEHARWSPSCSYVLLCKGKTFVEESCGEKKIETLSHEVLPKLIANHKMDSSYPDEIRLTLTKRIDLPDKKFNYQASIAGINLRHIHQQQQNQPIDPCSIPDCLLCKICYKDEMKVAFIPCGHVIACIQCSMTLDHCAVCRQQFSMAMRVFIYKTEETALDLPCSSSQCSDEPKDPMLCNVCHKEEMEAAFIPCRHVYACGKCATDMQECPMCAGSVCAFVQVYL